MGEALVSRGHEVFVLTRDTQKELPFPCKKLNWDEALQGGVSGGIDAAIHLAGENIAGGRWKRERKKLILQSRVDSTRLLWNVLTKSGGAKVLISASAIGFYGNRGDEVLTENSSRGDDFLADVCVAWEREIFAPVTSAIAMRVVALRFGMVLSADGGAFGKMLPLFRRGLGSVLGTGKQWVSWIHLKDLTDLMLFTLENSEMDGVYNAVSPTPIQNRDLTEELAKALGVKKFLPVPSSALKILFGGMSALFLNSQRVSCAKLLERGFVFRYTTLKDVLAEIAK